MTINRRQLLTYGAAVAMTPGLIARAQEGQSSRDASQDKRLNIVFIMADDIGREVLCNPEVYGAITPNITAFRERSVEFDTCYATPLCTTSRAEVLTGQYANHNGWPENPRQSDYCRAFDGGMYSVAHVMRRAGYRTGMAGKWQLAHFDADPQSLSRAGFDRYLAWAWVTGLERDERLPRYWQPSLFLENGVIRQYQDIYGPDAFNDFSLRFIRESVARAQPYFFYYPMALPHAPYCATPAEVCELDIEAIGEDAETCRRDVNLALRNQCEVGSAREEVPFTELVSYMDALFGRFMRGLAAMGQESETVVVLTADNGTKWDVNSAYRGGMVSGGKGTFSELGINVPLMILHPGQAPGRVTAPVDFTDFLPTFAEIAGTSVPTPVPIDGRSLMPALRGEAPLRDHVYAFYSDSSAISDGRWKLLNLSRRMVRDLRHDNRDKDHPFTIPRAGDHLYDLAADPLELSPIRERDARRDPETWAAWQSLSEARRALVEAFPGTAYDVHRLNSNACQ